jgi:hypothetical protein
MKAAKHRYNKNHSMFSDEGFVLFFLIFSWRPWHLGGGSI